MMKRGNPFGLILIAGLISLIACKDEAPTVEPVDFSERGQFVAAIANEIDVITGQRTTSAWAVDAEMRGGGIRVVDVAEPLTLARPKLSQRHTWYGVFVYDLGAPDRPPVLFMGELDALQDRKFYFIDTLQAAGYWEIIGFSDSENRVYLSHRADGEADAFIPWQLYSLNLGDLPNDTIPVLERTDAEDYPNAAKFGSSPFMMSLDSKWIGSHYVYTPSQTVIHQTLSLAEAPGTDGAYPVFDWRDNIPPLRTTEFPLMTAYGWNRDSDRILTLIRNTPFSSPFVGGSVLTSFTSTLQVVLGTEVTEQDFTMGMQPGRPMTDLASNEYRVAAWGPYDDKEAVVERRTFSVIHNRDIYEYYWFCTESGLVNATPMTFAGFPILFYPAVSDEHGYLYVTDPDSPTPGTGVPPIFAIPSTSGICS